MNKQEFNEYKQKEMFKDGVKLGPSMILSKSLERPMYAKHVGNENVLVIGGAGSGKTKSVIIPNLLQMTGSYVVHDPGGELYYQVGDVLREYGYDVKVFDSSLINTSNVKQQYAERMIHSTKNRVAVYDFDQKFYKFPSYLRRAAITEAIGKVSSYKSNLENWANEDPATRGRKPSFPKAGLIYPCLYRENMYQQTGEYYCND